jgi:hypothetical protein
MLLQVAPVVEFFVLFIGLVFINDKEYPVPK